MTPLSLQVQLLLTRVRWPWVLWIVLTLAAALVWGWGLPKARLDAQTLSQRNLAARQTTSSRPPPDVGLDPGITALTAFEERLADGDAQARLMRVLWRYAQASGVQLSKVDYRREDVTQAGYRRLTLTVPMTGSYPMIRQVVFQLMAEFPGLALIRLDMKREASPQAPVEATAHLVLYLRP